MREKPFQKHAGAILGLDLKREIWLTIYFLQE